MTRVVFVAFLPLALAAQTPVVVVSSANVQIDSSGTDSYSVQGSFTGVSLNGAQAIVFSVGQFGMAIPLSNFVQQPGTNVYQYTDTAGTTPFWISNLTVDLDANQFNATASGLVLSGLPNPFALQLGTDVAAACGVVRMQSVSPGQYQMNPADPPTQPCAMAGPPVAEPSVVPAGIATQVTVTVTASGLDANSAMLYPADDNAQPTDAALCTLTDNGDGTSSCTVSFNEANVGVLPLVVQATVGGQPVLAPGFSIQVVAPVTDADVQQFSDLQNIVQSVGDQAYSQYGDSAYARVQVLTALRQYMQAPVGLTGQPVSLNPDGWELGVTATSGAQITYVMGEPDAADSGDIRSAARGKLPALVGLAPAPVPTRSSPHAAHPHYTPPQSCGDYPRDIVQNNQVLLWDPGSIFFGGSDPIPSIKKVLSNSGCPSFTFTTLSGSDASDASFSTFSQYGTVVMMTHGGVDKFGRFFIATGTPGAKPVVGMTMDQQEGAVYIRDQNAWFEAVYPNYTQVQVSPNTVIFGAFCNGFLGSYPGLPPQVASVLPSQWPYILAPTSTNAFFGFKFPSNTMASGIAATNVFDSMLNNYEPASAALLDGLTVFSPNLALQPSGSNLAYVGNPHLDLSTMGPTVPSSVPLAASLDGTQSCSQNYMNVKWNNPATAGHLTAQTTLVNGSQDNFTNQASQAISSLPAGIPDPSADFGALADYLPDPNLPGLGDYIMADFFPNPTDANYSGLTNPLAGRACLNVTGSGLFVYEQDASIWDDQQPGEIAPIQSLVPGIKITQPYNVPLSDPGGFASQGATASITVAPNGPEQWTVTVKAGGANPNYPNPSAGPGSGPFQGKAIIGLQAINPGAPGIAKVMVSGQIQNAPFCQSPNGFTQVCTAADGTINVSDSRGQRVESGSLYLGDPNALGPSFSVSADSSCSGFLQPTKQCPSPGAVGITVDLTEAFATAPAPAIFSVTLNIQFVNQ